MAHHSCTHPAVLSVLQLLSISSRAVCDHKLVSQFNCVSDSSILNSEENRFIQLSTPEVIILSVVFLGGRGEGLREREREKEKHQFVVPLIHAFSGCSLYVPWPGIEPLALAYQDYTLTN